jgi:hypothetical protein
MEDDINRILAYYPGSNESVDPLAIKYATLGYTGPTTLNESSAATGQQQRAEVRHSPTVIRYR